LEGHETLSDAQAEELLAYLQETEFAPVHWGIGELAAKLLRDRAGLEVKAHIFDLCDTANDRQLYFYLLALSNDEHDWPRLEPHVLRACNSEEGTVRAFANELLWSQSPAIKAAAAVSK
jgi:hypothetical protein